MPGSPASWKLFEPLAGQSDPARRLVEADQLAADRRSTTTLPLSVVTFLGS